MRYPEAYEAYTRPIYIASYQLKRRVDWWNIAIANLDRELSPEEILLLFGMKSWLYLWNNMKACGFHFLRQCFNDNEGRWKWRIVHPSSPELLHETPTPEEMLRKNPSTNVHHVPNREMINLTEYQETGKADD